MTIDLEKPGIKVMEPLRKRQKEYAAMMVKQFNDIVAVQSTELENSSAHSSFGTLWNQFATWKCQGGHRGRKVACG